MKQEQKKREQIGELEACKLKRIINHPAGYDNYLKQLFFNAISQTYDPHTMYFPNAIKELFESSLSTENISYGFSVAGNKYGEIEVASMAPGGPAWKSNQINLGDIIEKISWENNESINLACSQAFDVEQLLNDPEHKTMTIELKKRNGSTISVSLTKSSVEIDDNTITSFLLTGKQKIGYIYLPGFYTDFTNSFPQGCANDVAKEIVKLKNENIEGLILDLRNNGGGALNEALGLFGIFINQGPFAIHSEKGSKPMLIKDMNRGTIFNGPLALLVNSGSASASELLAASLQDYNRALIVGSRTYGKSTGQVVLPMDSTENREKLNYLNKTSKLGFSKVTISKYYRINGKTAQLKGVKPDIELPTLYASLSHYEKDYNHSLSSDSVNKKVYYTPFPQFPLEQLKVKSLTRRDTITNFSKIYELNDSLKKESEKEMTLTLTPLKIKQHIKNNQTEERRFVDLLERKNHSYNVQNNRFNQPLIELNPKSVKNNKEQIEEIEQDLYIEETYQILLDYINLRE